MRTTPDPSRHDTHADVLVHRRWDGIFIEGYAAGPGHRPTLSVTEVEVTKCAAAGRAEAVRQDHGIHTQVASLAIAGVDANLPGWDVLGHGPCAEEVGAVPHTGFAVFAFLQDWIAVRLTPDGDAVAPRLADRSRRARWIVE